MSLAWLLIVILGAFAVGCAITMAVIVFSFLGMRR